MPERKSRHPLKDYLEDKKECLMSRFRDLALKDLNEVEEQKKMGIVEMLDIIEDIQTICKCRGRY